MILDTVPGMFGAVTVADQDGCRQLFIGRQCQGGVYLDDGEPTAISASAYQAGWLLAGVMHPDGTGVMLGLGSGSGAVALLNNFDEFMLTVVEIDPVVIKLACEHFPALNDLQDQGRLQIVLADATEFLMDTASHEESFDVGFLDSYQGENTGHAPPALIGLLGATCSAIYANVIGRRDGPEMKDLIKALDNVGQPAVDLFKCNSMGALANWIVTTEHVDAEDADEFEPRGAGIPGEQARVDYTQLLGSQVSLSGD